MFSEVNGVVTIIFGSLGGLAALIVAVNTFQLRIDAKKQKQMETDGTNRMDLFDKSQQSLQAALARADLENSRQRDETDEMRTAHNLEISRLRDEIDEMRELHKLEIAGLKKQIEELKHA